jgi:ATP-binding cassette subfamily B protein
MCVQQGADEIIVVENGTVVERGVHADLVAKKGKYFALVQHQLLVTGE